MAPTFTAIKKTAIDPLQAHKITLDPGLCNRGQYPAPARVHVLRQYVTSPDRGPVREAGQDQSRQHAQGRPHLRPHSRVQVAVSELKTAFQIGFLIFLPFLVIDLVVSSTLMSMGMVMLPPVFISLPFKILLFVLVDGWNLVTRSLVESFH